MDNVVVPVCFGMIMMLTGVLGDRGYLSPHRSWQSPKIPCGTDLSQSFDMCGVCGGDGTSCWGERQGQKGGPRSLKSRFLWRQAWTSCSVTCGSGQRRREASCVDVHVERTMKDTRCAGKPKPPAVVDTCVRTPCHPDLQKDDSSASWENDDVKRYLAELFNDQVPSVPKYVMGQWSACSVTCGQGTRSREVTCQRRNTFSQQPESLLDWECLGSKPDSDQVCDAGPCGSGVPLRVNAVEDIPRTFRWQTEGFSPCSRSCLGGTQESQLKCVEEGKEGMEGQEVPPTFCAGMRKPPVMVRSCNAIPCPPRWAIGDYGACSKQCGGGVMRRSVRCVQLEADGSATPVEDYRCPDPVPVSEMACNTDYCPAEWTSGPWEECSRTCGVGTQTRGVSCVTGPMGGQLVTVSDLQCVGPRPHSSRSCSLRDCPEDLTAPPVIKAENYTFIQLRRSRRVRLRVGGRVVLLPGQTVTVRCPVKNFHRPLIFWSRSFKLIPMRGRVRVTFGGNLKIRRGSPALDTGTYTCMAGPESADVHIDFLSRREALQKIRNIRRYIRTDSSLAAMILSSSARKQQDSALQDGHHNLTNKFLYVADDWSPCSVTCGSGHQKRRVTCTRITKKYVKILPERECEKLGLKKPEDTKKCSPIAECPHWVAGNWSACSLMTCVRDGYAQRRRKLQCAYSNGTSAPNDHCPQQRRPETGRLCVHIDCISHWTTSRWTPCRPRCGVQGVKMRMLTCSWRKTKLPAWTACRSHPRPTVRKVCKLRPCPRPQVTDCDDSSRYCSLARMLKMCRYDDFRRKCCRSCREYLQSTLS